MKGAEKIFIHGEEIARAKDVAQSKQEVMSTLFQEDANIRNELNGRIDGIPVIYPQELVDNGFDYSYRSTSETNNVTITVEPYGSGVGFTLQEDGWYQADNLGVDNSYAMAKIVFNNTSDTDKPVLLDLSQNAEQGFDYFVVSVLNAPLDDSLEDMSNVQDIFNNRGEFNIGVVFDVPPGINYKVIKFRKDGGGTVENERACFKAQEEQPLIIERRHMATTEDVGEQIKVAVSTVYKYKGSVANEASLPTTNNEVGDVYNCEDTGNNFAWDGTSWDKLAGTIDMSNYYTKDQSDANARAIADEKIAAIPVNNLLHYKGHVETVEDLPSTGQPSGEIGGNPANLSKTYTDTFNLKPSADTKRYESALNSRYTGTNYFIGYIDDYASYRTRGMLCTNYPETIKGFGIVNNMLFVYVTPTESKPVYARNQSGMRNEYYNTTPITYDDGTYYSAYKAWVTVTKPGWIQVGEQNTNGSNTLYGNLPQILKYIIPPETLAVQSSTAPNYYGLSTYAKHSSIVHLNTGYVYNEGYEIIKFNEDNSTSFVFAETTTELNDVYTVGNAYDIYRRNEKPAWEHWSQGVSKDYVDSIVGGVNTELESIINGEE